jgi:MFS family permease
MYPTELAEARPSKLPLAILLLASAISQIGDAMAMVALPWFVLQTTGSAALTGLAGAVTVLPAFLAGIFGGVLVDRLGYRRSSIIADLVSGLAIASTFSAIAMVSAPFGIALAGLLIEQRGLPWTLLIWAGCYTIVSVGMLFVPALRELDARPGVAQS